MSNAQLRNFILPAVNHTASVCYFQNEEEKKTAQRVTNRVFILLQEEKRMCVKGKETEKKRTRRTFFCLFATEAEMSMAALPQRRSRRDSGS
jgi:hypothetical protein